MKDIISTPQAIHITVKKLFDQHMADLVNFVSSYPKGPPSKCCLQRCHLISEWQSGVTLIFRPTNPTSCMQRCLLLGVYENTATWTFWFQLTSIHLWRYQRLWSSTITSKMQWTLPRILTWDYPRNCEVGASSSTIMATCQPIIFNKCSRTFRLQLAGVVFSMQWREHQRYVMH